MRTSTMKITIPKNEQHWKEMRAQDITSTEVAALFGCSPYVTEFELWHRKKNKEIVEIEANERMKWGTRLQDAIAEGIAQDQGWKIRRMNEYVCDPKKRMGSSFDFRILSESFDTNTTDDGLLEIKNVDSLIYKEGWIVDGDEVEAPPHIELQIQHQLAVTGLKYCELGALIGGNKLTLIHRDRDEEIIRAIRSKVAEFWTSIKEGKEPKPDFSQDSEYISKLYGYAEPGKVKDVKTDANVNRLVGLYKGFTEQAKAFGDQRDAVKAELLTLVGDAEKIIGDNFTITANVVGEQEISYTRKAYRTFRVNFKKEKTS